MSNKRYKGGPESNDELLKKKNNQGRYERSPEIMVTSGDFCLSSRIDVETIFLFLTKVASFIFRRSKNSDEK